MSASIGRIVQYKLSQQDADNINKRRTDASTSGIALRNEGSQVHVGNNVAEGDVFPMIVTRVWSGTTVNGSVMLDGNDTYWATSVSEGGSVGNYAWPVIVK